MGSSGVAGSQVPHHGHQLGHCASGFGCRNHGSWVSFARICQVSAPPHWLSQHPFLLRSLLCADITRWAPRRQSPGLSRSPQPPGPEPVCPLGRRVDWPWLSAVMGFVPIQPACGLAVSPSGARPGLGVGLVLSSRKEPVSPGRPDAPESHPGPAPPPGPSCGVSVPRPSPGTSAPEPPDTHAHL